MSENDNPAGIFCNRLLGGWSKIFGKKHDNGKGEKQGHDHDKLKLKPFPPNHFFSQEELCFLAKNQEQCSRLQSWALQMSLWARSKSNEQDRNNPQFFPAVQWQDGLMSTWIDSEARPDSIDQQADRLYQLQLDGYKMDAAFVRMIEARACRSLVGNLFVDERQNETASRKGGKHFIWIEAVVDKPGEDLALSIYHYNKISHHHESEETVSYKQFKPLLENKEMAALGGEGQRKWNDEATARDMAEEKFTELVCLMRRSNICQGMFPAHSSISIRQEDGKDYVPMAWALSGDEIKIDFDPQVSISKSSLLITSNDSYRFVDVLDYIDKTISEQDASQELLTFVRIFGKDFCGDKVLSSGKYPLCWINGIEIDRVTAKASDTIVAFNNDTLETVTLSSEDRITLLKAVIRRSDELLTELKSDLQRTTDEKVQGILQDRLNNIHQGLSAYNTGDNYHTLDELWQHITSIFRVKQSAETATVVPASAVKVIEAPQSTEVRDKEPLVHNQNEVQSVQEPIAKSDDGIKMPKQVDEAPSIEPKKSQIPEGYIRIEPSSKGRWHTAEMLRREAYRVYGKLLSAKLKKQLDNDNNPWVSKQMLTPRDIKGTVYTGPNAIMLALWTEQQGFELPFFITEEELRANELGILQDAKSLFILHKNGTSRVYNIAQTTFPVTQRRSYESLKLNMIATERKKTSGYQFLDADGFCKTALKFDGIPGLSVYDYAEKVIHIAPKSNFETEDDYYRDLAVAMVESTREVDFDTLRLDTYLFENLVSHLGSGIISQSCRFNATNPEYSRIWRERLENNPEYTKRILEQSDAASGQVLQSALT